jgi:hypothetical protein
MTNIARIKGKWRKWPFPYDPYAGRRYHALKSEAPLVLFASLKASTMP